jgi:PAS domain S-box
VLLLLPETRSDVIEIDGGEIADNVFSTTVDEIVSLPIQQAELGWRIQALLRLRSQSADLSAQTTKLRLFRHAVEDAGQAVAITTPAAAIEYVNAAFEATTGYDEAAVVGQAWWQLYDEPTTDEYRRAIETTLETGAVWRGELPVQRADGEQIDTRQTLSPVFDDDNRIQAYVATLQDITDRKRRQDELRQYKRAIVGATDLIAAVDRDGMYLFANPNYKKYHGIDADSVTGLALDDVLDGQRHPRMQRNRERALDGRVRQLPDRARSPNPRYAGARRAVLSNRRRRCGYRRRRCVARCHRPRGPSPPARGGRPRAPAQPPERSVGGSAAR